MIRSAMLVLTAALVAGCGSAVTPSSATTVTTSAATPLSTPEPAARKKAPAPKPLAGVRIAIDPGHQLGNSRFPRQINRPVPAGGFTKPCNTTGTATNGGYPEATFTFQVSRRLAKRLRKLGATVVLTRTTNSTSQWGPCVDARGQFGAKHRADLMISIHADGASAGARGFHVITPKSRRPWTDDIAAPSLRLAKAVRGGLDRVGIPRSTYIGGGTALSIRSDLGTLNMSDVPTVMVELGNMRNKTDAKRMTTAAGRGTYAKGLTQGIRKYLRR